MVSKRVRRVAVFLAACAVCVGAPGAGADAQTLPAATEIEAFVAAPGVLRTDLRARHIAYDAVGDQIIAILNGEDESVLVSVNPETLDVEAEVTIDIGSRDVHDLVVSGDGDTVFVLSLGTVRKFRTSTLELIESVAIASEYGYASLVVAPTMNDRFAVVGRAVQTRQVSLYLDDSRVDDSQLVAGSNATFGATDDVFFIAGIDSLRRYEIGPGSGLASTATGSDGGYSRQSTLGGMFFRDGRIILAGSRSGITRYSAESLDFLDRDDLDLPSGLPDVALSADGQLFVEGTPFVRADVVAPALRVETFRSSIARDFAAVAALGGGVVAVIEAGGGGAWMTIVSTDLMLSEYGEFFPLEPVRLIDTRVDVGDGPAGPVAEDSTLRVDIAGRGGVPTAGVLAVVMNATVVDPSSGGYVSISPSGAGRPEVSSLNFSKGQTLANAVTVSLGDEGSIDVYNRFGRTDVILDAVGYYVDQSGEPGARYVPATPLRLVDTRVGLGVDTRLPVGAGETIEVDVPASGYRDAQVESAVLNITAINGSAKSFLTVFPGDVAQPLASSLNFEAGEIRANLVVSKVSANGTIRIFNRSGEVHIAVDFFGSYQRFGDYPADQGGRFLPVDPFRAFDSRQSSPFPGSGQLEPRSALIIPNSSGYTDIINLTAASTTSDGFLSVIGWEDRQQLQAPRTSTVNFRAGEVVANAAYQTGVPNNAVVNSAGFTHVVIDVFGYLTPAQLRDVEDVWND